MTSLMPRIAHRIQFPQELKIRGFLMMASVSIYSQNCFGKSTHVYLLGGSINTLLYRRLSNALDGSQRWILNAYLVVCDGIS